MGDQVVWGLAVNMWRPGSVFVLLGAQWGSVLTRLWGYSAAAGIVASVICRAGLSEVTQIWGGQPAHKQWHSEPGGDQNQLVKGCVCLAAH